MPQGDTFSPNPSSGNAFDSSAFDSNAFDSNAYNDAVGWFAIKNLLSAAQAARIVQACDRVLEQADSAQPGSDEELLSGDKPHAGTRRLVSVFERVPETTPIADHPDLRICVEAIIGPDIELKDAVYRSPQPGFGAQKLHADAVPKLEAGPNLTATVIVALVDFTAENGATRIIPGSNHRPDLQRRSGNLDHHVDEIRLLGSAGSAFVFSGHLLHSGTRNCSAGPRPALQLIYGITSGSDTDL